MGQCMTPMSQLLLPNSVINAWSYASALSEGKWLQDTHMMMRVTREWLWECKTLAPPFQLQSNTNAYSRVGNASYVHIASIQSCVVWLHTMVQLPQPEPTRNNYWPTFQTTNIYPKSVRATVAINDQSKDTDWPTRSEEMDSLVVVLRHLIQIIGGY